MKVPGRLDESRRRLVKLDWPGKLKPGVMYYRIKAKHTFLASALLQLCVERTTNPVIKKFNWGP